MTVTRPRTTLRRAFTLVELLVVVAVISILAGLLFPVFAQTRDKARQSACASNLHQLGAAVSLYTQDYDERFPQTHPTATPWTLGDDEDTLVSPWRALMEPYVKSMGVFRCPTDSSPTDWHPASYGPNGYTVYGASLSEVSRPTETIYGVELQDGAVIDDVSPWYGADMIRDGVLAEKRHAGGSNYLYVDGHVRWMTFGQTWSPVNQYPLART
jgi:prepilin-type N-terminal cleavage/methylation domain-containing protein/prepilin-type processing-associated H-X9-DG protein